VAGHALASATLHAESLQTHSIADAHRSIAAHVDHVRYGLSLMNGWSEGHNPFKDADWSASWK